MDPDDLESLIDLEWLAAEGQVSKGYRQARQEHGKCKSPRIPRRAAAAGTEEAAPAVRPTLSRTRASSSMSSWSSTDDTSSDAAAKLQRRIDELERQIAAAEVGVSDAERRAAQRKWVKERQAQREARGAEPRTSANYDSSPEPLAGVVFAPDLAADAADTSTSDDEAAGAPVPTAAASFLSGLAIVVANLASTHFDDAALTPLAEPSPSDASETSSLASPGEGWPTALHLASAAQPLWRALSRSEWKQRAAATVRLQRTQRGRAARASTRELALARQQLVSEFLQAHPQWQRKASASDLQALVLPRLDTGAPLGRGAFGCVYQPRPVWHFPRSGIAVKACSLRNREAASSAALEAALLRKVAGAVGTHPNVVTLHGSFLVGEHARLAFDLATRGDLYEHLWRRRGVLPRSTALDLAAQLAAGLAHLHSADVAHRDLKLSNALLFDCGKPCTSGCCASVIGGGGSSSGSSSSAAGARGVGAGRGVGSALVVKIADLGLGVHASSLTPLPVLDGSAQPPRAPEAAAAPSSVSSLAASPSAASLTAAELAELRGARRGVSRELCGSATTMAPEVLQEKWYCPFRADAWSLGTCLLALLAPREFDEFDFERIPFYPFTRADVEYDEEYDAFASPPPPPPPPRPPTAAAASLPPPGLFQMRTPPPPGLAPALVKPPAAAGKAPGLTAPPGLPTPSSPNSVPPGLRRRSREGSPATTAGGSVPASGGGVVGLVERRADWYGLALPEPPLPPTIVRLLDSLLTLCADARLPVADAVRQLREAHAKELAGFQC